jgi:hypothetical protein
MVAVKLLRGVIMSAPTPTPAPSIVASSGDNQFKLSDHEKKTHVTLNLETHGPLVQGSTAQAPTLQYDGVEGTFSFSGEQVAVETSALGKMFTVTLNIVPDLRTLLFTLLLPSVTHQAGEPKQAFDTLAIKSERHSSIQGPPANPGAATTYTCLKMHGTAAKVQVPF